MINEGISSASIQNDTYNYNGTNDAYNYNYTSDVIVDTDNYITSHGHGEYTSDVIVDTGNYTIINDDGEYNPNTELSDYSYYTPETVNAATIEFTTVDTQANITLNDDMWFNTSDDRKISLEQIVATMDAVKLLGDIFKHVQFKPAISKSLMRFMEIAKNLPDVTEPIEKEKPEHIEKELFEI